MTKPGAGAPGCVVAIVSGQFKLVPCCALLVVAHVFELSVDDVIFWRVACARAGGFSLLGFVQWPRLTS